MGIISPALYLKGDKSNILSIVILIQNSALEILKSATKYGTNLKAIAVTGSINAITTGADTAARVYDSSAWLPVSIADAIGAQNPYISYCVAKAESEKAIWKYVEEEKPKYSVSVLLPALIFGPPIQPVKSLKGLNYSTGTLYELINGSHDVVPATTFPSYVSPFIYPVLVRGVDELR